MAHYEIKIQIDMPEDEQTETAEALVVDGVPRAVWELAQTLRTTLEGQVDAMEVQDPQAEDGALVIKVGALPTAVGRE